MDGPGIRTTVFFKGCNLKCVWCHNPESQTARPQIMFYKEKCTHCGRCGNVTEYNTDFICFNDAKEICGKEYTLDELLKEILKDKSFYDNSNGGITFSGGECMLQIDFLCEILKKCKENGIHTAVDTAGNVPWEYFERILKYTDLFLYDIKLLDSEKHIKYTGCSNKVILDNLKKLFEHGAEVCIRIPIVGSVNDSAEEMLKIKKFLHPYNPVKIELLPYHNLGTHKYDALDMEKSEFEVPSKAVMEKLNSLFKYSVKIMKLKKNYQKEDANNERNL